MLFPVRIQGSKKLTACYLYSQFLHFSYLGPLLVCLSLWFSYKMTYPLGKWVFKVTCPAKNSTCPALPHETFFESCDHPQWTYYSHNLLLRSVTVLLFHKLKLLLNTPGVKTYLKPRSENSPIGIQCVETLSPLKIPIWRLFHWDMLAIWLLRWMANLERITNILKNMPSCFFICHWGLGCGFWENPDPDFWVQKQILRFFEQIP